MSGSPSDGDYFVPPTIFEMQAGQIEANGGEFNPAAPFGGYKQSGLGREGGSFGLEEFLETKAIQR